MVPWSVFQGTGRVPSDRRLERKGTGLVLGLGPGSLGKGHDDRPATETHRLMGFYRAKPINDGLGLGESPKLWPN